MAVCILLGAIVAVLPARAAVQGTQFDQESESVDPGGGEYPGDGSVATPFETSSFDAGVLMDGVLERVHGAVGWLKSWYQGTPAAGRVVWGGLAACAGLGLFVCLERLVRLRRRAVVPDEFVARFLDRLREARLDSVAALDHCELNPSPAGRVALAAVRRWGRPAADLERAVALAHRVESEGLRRNVGTLRRIAALAPLVGLLGTLYALGGALEGLSPVGGLPIASAGAAGPAAGGSPVAGAGASLAAALAPLTAGVMIATLAVVAYDGLSTRIEKLAAALDRLGWETIDAIALAAASAPQPVKFAHGGHAAAAAGPVVHGVAAPARTPHQAGPPRDGASEPLRRRELPAESGF
jgi:biopolymer transport protein ExbB